MGIVCIQEKKLKSEKGVRVGERDDTLPPEYRFKEDKDKKPLPPPPKEVISFGCDKGFVLRGNLGNFAFMIKTQTN